jgi:hypothetical protein
MKRLKIILIALAIPSISGCSSQQSQPESKSAIFLERIRQSEYDNVGYDDAGHVISVVVPASDATDDNVRLLGNLEFIQTIRLGSCARVTTNGILSLTKLQHLTSLELCGNNPGHDLVPAISRLRNLRQLRFAAAAFTPADAKYLSEMTNLVKLGISNPMTLGTNGLLSLTNLTQLESCPFTDPKVPAGLVNQFSKSSNSNVLKTSR